MTNEQHAEMIRQIQINFLKDQEDANDKRNKKYWAEKERKRKQSLLEKRAIQAANERDRARAEYVSPSTVFPTQYAATPPLTYKPQTLEERRAEQEWRIENARRLEEFRECRRQANIATVKKTLFFGSLFGLGAAILIFRDEGVALGLAAAVTGGAYKITYDSVDKVKRHSLDDGLSLYIKMLALPGIAAVGGVAISGMPQGSVTSFLWQHREFLGVGTTLVGTSYITIRDSVQKNLGFATAAKSIVGAFVLAGSVWMGDIFSHPPNDVVSAAAAPVAPDASSSSNSRSLASSSEPKATASSADLEAPASSNASRVTRPKADSMGAASTSNIEVTPPSTDSGAEDSSTDTRVASSSVDSRDAPDPAASPPVDFGNAARHATSNAYVTAKVLAARTSPGGEILGVWRCADGVHALSDIHQEWVPVLIAGYREVYVPGSALSTREPTAAQCTL